MKVSVCLLKGFCWLAMLAMALGSDLGAQTPCPAGSIQTSSGKVCDGVQVQVTNPSTGITTAVNNFLGIPYAQAPVGNLRWAPPAAPPSSWQSNSIHANQAGNICPQFAPSVPPACSTDNLPIIGNEDCLYLNVWTPQGSASGSLPVMVFIHGGAFIEGSGSAPVFDGSFMAATGNVVVVSFNYRLGALGFLAYQNPNDSSDQLTGNFGFIDQQAALAWVQKNIQGFGGDPKQVTIFGESAGAMSVGLHMVSVNYSATNTVLFQAGIMESNPLGIPYKTLEVAQSSCYGQAYVGDLTQGTACDGSTNMVSCMRANLTQDQILTEQGKFIPKLSLITWQGFEPELPWTPVIDNQLILGEPIERVQTVKPQAKAVLLGTNQDEGLLFVDLLLKKLGYETLSAYGYQNVILPHLFSSTTASTIMSFTPTGSSVQPYAPVSGDNAPVLAQVFTDYLFTCANRYFAKQALLVTPTLPTFVYQFDQATSFPFPACPLAPNPTCANPPCPACAAPQVCHGAELPYVFHSASDIGQTFKPATEDPLSRIMVGFWSEFATSLDPNGQTTPRWPAFNAQTGPYIVLDVPLSQASYFPNPVCDQLWDSIGYNLIPSQTSCTTTGAGSGSCK